MGLVKHITLDLSEEEYVFLKQLKGEKDWKTFIMELVQSQNPVAYYSRKITEITASVKELMINKNDHFRQLLIDKLSNLYILALANKIDELKEAVQDIAELLGLEICEKQEQEQEVISQ